MLAFETIQPGDGGRSRQMRFGLDRQVQEPRRVVLLHLGKLATGNQLLGCKLMDGLQHGKAGVGRRISIGRLLEANQTGIVESVEALEDR